MDRPNWTGVEGVLGSRQASLEHAVSWSTSDVDRIGERCLSSAEISEVSEVKSRRLTVEVPAHLQLAAPARLSQERPSARGQTLQAALLQTLTEERRSGMHLWFHCPRYALQSQNTRNSVSRKILAIYTEILLLVLSKARTTGHSPHVSQTVSGTR